QSDCGIGGGGRDWHTGCVQARRHGQAHHIVIADIAQYRKISTQFKLLRATINVYPLLEQLLACAQSPNAHTQLMHILDMKAGSYTGRLDASQQCGIADDLTQTLVDAVMVRPRYGHGWMQHNVFGMLRLE